MNASPIRRRAIAAILASAISLAGCTNKASTAPAGQTPAGTATTSPDGTNTASAAPAPQAPAPQPAPLVLPRGTRLEVRLNRTIDVKHTESGDPFNGSRRGRQWASRSTSRQGSRRETLHWAMTEDGRRRHSKKCDTS